MKHRASSIGRFTLLAAISSAVLPLSATAAPQKPPTDDEAQDSGSLPELEITAQKVATHTTTGTRTQTPIISTPQSISAITRAELDARGVQRLTEAVSYTAGVLAADQGMDSRWDGLRIRGYSAGSDTSNFYLDGLRGPSGGQWTKGQFDTFGLERVEVVKGPSGVSYGLVTPGGLINAVSKRPTDDPFGSAGLQYGSHDTIQGTFDTSGGLGMEGLRYRIAGLYRDGNSEVDHTELSRFFIAPSLTWDITDRTSLTILTQYQKDEGGATFQFLPTVGTLTRGPFGYLDNSTFLGEPDWNVYDREQFAIGYQFQHQFNDHLTFRQNLRYTHVDNLYHAMVGGTGSTPTTFGRRAIVGDGISDGLAVDTLLEAKFETGPVQHTLVGGVDYVYSDWSHLRLVNSSAAAVGPPINIYDPVYTPGIDQTLKASTAWAGPDVDATESQLGIYLQEQAVFGPLHATLGIRHDWHRVDYDQANLTGSDHEGNGIEGAPTKFKVTPSATTWRGGLLYLFDNGLAPYVSYTTSFEAAPYSNLDLAGDPLREPVESEQYEIGLKYQPWEKALFTASLFQLTEENGEVQVQAGPPRYAQVGESETRGFEFEGRMEMAEGLDLIATYTYLDTEITRSSALLAAQAGNDLPGVPEHLASLWLTYTFQQTFLEGLSVGGGVRYVGSSYGDAANSIEIPHYMLFDAAINYDLGRASSALEGMSVRLSATNLADKRYVATATGNTSAFYGSGRFVNLGLNYRW
ncbi:TonB-dependent siderophore receptor [Luteolibacter sp. SL250]|uniref:TonB-dependent siderophore receptor n=1 Tax=Luteolibacter sp. SL250 TaxID=2995170 RepID=UPI00226EB486|nr:TonB-dependent siderophore receptor [Luteolibacter sp. SL250]WAC19095.1 TonB-dependent siderophore receptor [Luteolibacter sp. SL250]